MALVFVLALLLDSACAAACVPAELEAAAEHCSSDSHGAESPERGCDLHGHLKPVVKDRGFLSPATTSDDALALIEIPQVAIDFCLSAATLREVVRHVPPLLQRHPVLRI